MPTTIFLITPPFTQLNTPYPGTAYVKGFLNTKNISSFQADLGIEVILKLFSKEGLIRLFAEIEGKAQQYSENSQRIIALQDEYIKTIDPVILFLQGKNPTLSHLICQEDFLPEASRFAQLEELDWAFGTMGTQDKGKHLATLYLEDISDLIVECIDPHFGFSRYAERLGRSANSFDELHATLQQEYTYIDQITLQLLEERLQEIQPEIVAFSVPFPGNLYSAFRCAQWIKKHHPEIKVAMGGGFPNTELRSLTDTRVMEFFDFITLDDGEAPVENMIAYVEGKLPKEALKRTFVLSDGEVTYINNPACRDYKQSEVGTPDYSDLLLDKYISVIEIVNPMHRMWSDGRWNKLTMAHGCYWGKCTFCDISLDYIKVYEPIAAKMLVDRMEELMAQTGQNGFHFVDEAAPPALMRAVALEILKRKLAVTWWTNIRFEKSFTKDLCLLLKASGCIAVSGGLEVASDRLLELIQKGVTVAQVARVNRNFTEAGIMVHAYLMYGFPTQTAQETIDSLEMVRQLFELGILQSGFWHQFAMTAHSPVGMYPEKFGVQKETDTIGSFANNDIVHIDTTGTDHDRFSFGLKKSLFNYMHGICFDYPLQDWFEFKIPRTKVPHDYIYNALQDEDNFTVKSSAKIVWTGGKPAVSYFTKNKKGRQFEMASLTFHDKKESFTIQVNKEEADWLKELLPKISVANTKVFTFNEVKSDYENSDKEDFELFWYSKPINTLRDFGLLVL
ncbi:MULTISPECIES: radical SAM protein [unclassified Flavobacterium]|uniref:B12-binding domain-containing radical SAM protein n=1 Tax=unclassified Flavobacterium TaxID=196869 RepID=UPI00095E13E4|nr:MULTISPECIES: radical SAM protein [unclassified Flavobacterium]MBN9283124.1 radical SAM protein [Flavobacterium sp.]OJV67753.1 MAG: radical SAM protein [Flavobacterium sp. 40-81]